MENGTKREAGLIKFLKRQGAVLRETGFFVFLNALGIKFDLVIKSQVLDPIRKDAGDPVRSWLGTSLPLLALYIGMNVTWLLMSRKNRSLGIGRLSIWLLVCLAWALVLARDPINLQGVLELLNGTAYPG